MGGPADPGGTRPRFWVAAPAAAVALTTLFLVAIVVLAALLVMQGYRSALAAGEARARSSAHVVAAHIEWMVQASDQALRRIDTALGPDPIHTSPDAISNIADAVGNLPGGFHYSVYDESGRLRLSSNPDAAAINVSDRPYFRRLRDGDRFVISQQLEERLTGERGFVIARPITRDGSFRGVASMAIPISKMFEFWRSLELGPFSSVSVIRADGWLVARYPALDGPMDLSGTPLFVEHLPRSPTGVYYSTASPADGEARIVGYRQVTGWPLVATAGIHREEALQPFWALTRAQLAFGLPAIALLLAASLWIARLLRLDARRRAALEQALERNQYLFREIHHRVKNNLQAVLSLVRLQPLHKEARDEMARRIAAMVAVHEQIYRSDQFDRVEVAPYVERLVREIALAHDTKVEVDIVLDPITVSRDQALPLGLIVNEVVSNAFKHAFTGREGGRIAIHLASEGTGTARLLIEDDGPGHHPADATGMGGRLIAGFAAQMGGQFAIDDSRGTSFSLTFPIEDSPPSDPAP